MTPEAADGDRAQLVTVAEAARITGRSASWFYTKIAIGAFARRADDQGRALVPLPRTPLPPNQKARRGSHLRLVVNNA